MRRIAIAAAVWFAWGSGPAWARSSGMTGRSGGCSGCHGVSSGDVQAQVLGPDVVQAGETVTYTVVATSSDPAHTAAGFSLQAFGGTLTAGPGTWTTSTSLTHQTPATLTQGEARWTFSWTAPSSGTIAMAAAVLGVNRNRRADAGDRWATAPGLLVTVVPAPEDTDPALVDTDPAPVDTGAATDDTGPDLAADTDSDAAFPGPSAEDTYASDTDAAYLEANGVCSSSVRWCCAQVGSGLPGVFAVWLVVGAVRRRRA